MNRKQRWLLANDEIETYSPHSPTRYDTGASGNGHGVLSAYEKSLFSSLNNSKAIIFFLRFSHAAFQRSLQVCVAIITSWSSETASSVGIDVLPVASFQLKGYLQKRSPPFRFNCLQFNPPFMLFIDESPDNETHYPHDGGFLTSVSQSIEQFPGKLRDKTIAEIEGNIRFGKTSEEP